ncbi:MAG: c-type cytochrome biogenesis protein CcmI [Rhodospirillales bacterium]|nr:c-type cytochrome biogenesis protein CcmI [Rhodospirillales bacterium]MDE0378181.1 c-type cytochrome biogenesis protein CcmI [Rhodospirillales bacterium]
MIFALAAALLTALAVAVVLVPVLRRHRRGPARADYDLTVYRDQLRELESDRARGLVSAEQEEAARTEIERRMLRAARAREAAQEPDAETEAEPVDARARGPSAWRRRAWALGLGLCIPALAAGVYASLGSPGLPGRPFAGIERPAATAEATAAISESVEQLAARLRSDPGDLDGWVLLGRSYVVLQRYAEAADALRQAAALSGDDPDVAGMLGEAVVWANGGVVVPEAAGAFRQVLEARPDDPAARFHLALARAQAGQVRDAYEMWLALAADTPADAAWRGDLEALIRQAAGVLDVEPGELPQGPSLADAPTGPTADDVAAAADMSPEERMEMIRGMVEGLAARLEENPDDAEGWRRLARSYAVLGEAAKAAETLRRAVELAPDDLETLHAYARALAGDLGSSAPPPEAVLVYERILALAPDDGAALWFVGLAAADRGDVAAARVHWERLLPLLAPGTEEHEALRTALDGL